MSDNGALINQLIKLTEVSELEWIRLWYYSDQTQDSLLFQLDNPVLEEHLTSIDPEEASLDLQLSYIAEFSWGTIVFITYSDFTYKLLLQGNFQAAPVSVETEQDFLKILGDKIHSAIEDSDVFIDAILKHQKFDIGL